MRQVFGLGRLSSSKCSNMNDLLSVSTLLPLSNRTNFNGCTRWSSSVWKVFADELPVNTDETLMNFWAKVTHLDPYSLIESSSVFNGGSRGRNPAWKASQWTPMKMLMKFWVLRAAATYTSCWAVGLLMTSFAVEWFSSVFIGVWSERVEEKFIGVLRAEFSPLIHREFNG